MSYNLRHLKYFIATAELGQVSRAAIELSISQSAVTAAIRELEAVLGARLFQRSSLGMTLTEAGRRFLALGYDIIAKVDESLRASDTVALQGTLELAASYTVIGYYLPFHLERLARTLPDVKLVLREMSRTALEGALVSGKIDIGVALTSNITDPEISSETLIRSPRRLWLPSHHPLLAQDKVTLAEISREPYIMLTVDEAAHTSQRYWAGTRFEPQVILRTSSVEAVRSMVANGQGISILSDMVYRPWSLEGRRLETADIVNDVPAMDVGLVWRRNAHFTPVMSAFRNYFRSLVGTPQNGSDRQ
jgi:DNA-binding transcriptional LysR family regulator